MGYHGFGMRKEVYARKPKKAFDKIKKHNKKNPYSSPKKRDDREVYIHTYHKPAYKRWWFILGSIIFIGAMTHYYLKTYVWAPAEKNTLERQFSEEGIYDYYLDHKATFDSVYRFMKSTNGALTQMGHNNYLGPIFIVVESKKGRPHSDYLYFQPSNKVFDYYVEDGNLIYLMNGGKIKESDNWSLDIQLTNINQLNASFLDYLKVKRSDLDKLLRLLNANKWRIKVYPNGAVWQFEKLGKQHEFYIANEKGEFPIRNPESKKELAPGVLWD